MKSLRNKNCLNVSGLAQHFLQLVHSKWFSSLSDGLDPSNHLIQYVHRGVPSLTLSNNLFRVLLAYDTWADILFYAVF